jgi:hypothetical protein
MDVIFYTLLLSLHTAMHEFRRKDLSSSGLAFCILTRFMAFPAFMAFDECCRGAGNNLLVISHLLAFRVQFSEL